MNAVNTEPKWPVTFLRVARGAGVISLVLLSVAGPGFRWRLVPFDIAMNWLFLFGVLAAFAALVFGGLALFASSSGRRQPQRIFNWLAFLFGAAVVLSSAYWYGQLRSAPLLHDISTDTAHPPVFVEVLKRRADDGAMNSAEYLRDYVVGATAVNAPEEQSKAYPDIQPVMLLRIKPDQAFLIAEKAARAMGWEIVAVVPGEGRIEATDTTVYFGFKDDIAIRVRSELNGRGSVIDVRSSSRIGSNDVGANARRIRAYSERLRHPG
jgi:uncharacterized protein (DUF1499 family)